MPAVELPNVAGAQAVAFLLVLCRVGGLFLLAPIFSASLIPPRAKLVLAGAVALALTPIAAEGQTLPSDVVDLSMLLVKEVVVGLAFAFTVALVTAGVQVAAGLIDTVIGFAFASIVDPVNNQQGAVYGRFYSLFALLVFVTVGGDHVMIAGLAKSYVLLPLDEWPGLAAIGELATEHFVQVFTVGLQIAAPVVLALLIATAAFGIVARAVPQMNVFFVGMPAKILLSFAVVGASLPFVSGFLTGALEQAVFDALDGLRVR